MDSAVRNLYKRMVYAIRECYPGEFSSSREQLRRAFRQEGLSGTSDKRAPDQVTSQLGRDAKRKRLERGEFLLRELMALGRFSKYRAMKKRYASKEGDAGRQGPKEEPSGKSAS
mmetsp:Transcript_155/g.272  ORF Transcript_155/g.272 Transcript_155/m.272 type:complete len:114 (-) Transcript_155:60-401(-)